MPKILINIQEEDTLEIKKKAASFGLTTSAYIRQVLKDSLRKKNNNEQATTARTIRRLIPVLAEAFGRTHNASPETINKLEQILLKKYDWGEMSENKQ